jgi:ABC-type uncharacterized transport system ATPase subunit
MNCAKGSPGILVGGVIFEARDPVFSFEGSSAPRGASLSVDRGETRRVMGPSSPGKTPPSKVP